MATKNNNNETIMNILRGNTEWNKKTYTGIEGEIKDTKSYIKAGTAYTDDVAQGIRAGYAADGVTAQKSAVASGAADNGGNPDSYAAALGDKADLSYRSAGEEAVRSRALTTESGLITSDQNLIDAFKVTADANSADFATGAGYANNAQQIELAEKNLEKMAGSGNTTSALSGGESGSDSPSAGDENSNAVANANNNTITDILRGNNYWNKQTHEDVQNEVKDTKEYIKSGTAYKDEAADVIRDSFSAKASDEDSYTASQGARRSGAYGAAAENAVIARAQQTEGNLTASDQNLISALQVTANANSTDLAVAADYENTRAANEVEAKRELYEAEKEAAETAAKSKKSSGSSSSSKTDESESDGETAPTERYSGQDVATAYFMVWADLIDSDPSGDHSAADERAFEILQEQTGISDDELTAARKTVSDYNTAFENGATDSGILMSPSTFYTKLYSGTGEDGSLVADTAQTFGFTDYLEYVEAVNEAFKPYSETQRVSMSQNERNKIFSEYLDELRG